MTTDSTDFASALSHLDSFDALTNEHAQAFLTTWPLDAWFRELSGPHVPASLVDTATQAFARIFATEYGASLLPSIPPYASAALQSPSALLRRLAVQQLGRLLVAPAPQSQEACLDLLLSALQDADVGVASVSEAALRQLGRPEAASQQRLPLLLSRQHPCGSQLAQLAGSADPVLRMRALTLMLALAAQSPAAGQAVQGSGLLQPLLQELQDPDDLLSCMAALQLLHDAAQQCDAAMAASLAHVVMPYLAALLVHPEPVLQGGALKAAASLLGASLQAGAAPMAVDGAVLANGAAGAAAADPLVAALKAVLDVGGVEEVAQEVEEAALDAVAILGLHAPGAEALLSHPAGVAGDVAYKALGRPPSPAQRIAALHALAAVAGAERSGRSGKLLCEEAEDALREAQQLEQPFLEQRAAVYRCVVALAARDWLAGAVCGHTPLLAFLLNPQSESSKQGCEWRHACVCALAATIADVAAGGIGAGGAHQAALMDAASSVQAAVRVGPYGSSSTGAAEPLVATMPA
ncbi:hypothetical protein ACK3TF_002584 [Chlorella vulgaris]